MTTKDHIAYLLPMLLTLVPFAKYAYAKTQKDSVFQYRWALPFSGSIGFFSILPFLILPMFDFVAEDPGYSLYIYVIWPTILFAAVLLHFYYFSLLVKRDVAKNTGSSIKLYLAYEIALGSLVFVMSLFLLVMMTR